MINIENDVFTIVADRLRAEFPGIYVTGEYLPVAASFPAVSIVEADNAVMKSMSKEKVDDFARLMYEVNVYSNKTSGKKSEAKAIFEVVDEALTALKFTRISRTQVPNYADATIYRLNGRYEVVVGKASTAGKYMLYQNT